MYLDDYKKITKNNVTTEYYFLENDVVVTKETGTSGSSSIKLYQAVTDNLGSILAVYGETNNLVFKAKYDVWGKQTVYKNALGLYRGYTGHEMLPGFELINMGGRMYDPVVARFLSCDNFVQEPTNSQNFNRYSYCLNNPLKYTDPSGNFVVTFGAAIGFASFCLSTYLDPSFDNIVKSAAICAVTYGIGSACQALASVQGLSTSACELVRASAHGFSSGLFAAIEGGDFTSQFVAGFVSSYVGSYINGSKLLTLGSTTLAGGIASWATGGDFLEGAKTGFRIGLLNHTMHDEPEKPLKETLDDVQKTNSRIGAAAEVTKDILASEVCTRAKYLTFDTKGNILSPTIPKVTFGLNHEFNWFKGTLNTYNWSKGIGIGAGIMSIGLNLLDMFFVSKELKVSHCLDAAMGVLSFIPPYGTVVGLAYFGGNMILKTTTDKSIGHHVDKLFESNFGLVDGRITKINLWNNE